MGGVDGERRGGFALAAEIALADARAAGDPFVAGFDIAPHVVVAAIGQNDANPVNFMAQNYDCDASKHWRSAYAGWICACGYFARIARIILTTTILGHDAAWDRAIDEVCRELSLTDGRVHHFLYSKNGCGTPGHIRGSEAAGMAKELAGFIETLPHVWED